MINLAAVPAFVDIADSTFAVDQPMFASVLQQLAHNAKFAMVRREVFETVAVNGDVVAAPVSPIDGYQYSYGEVVWWWTRVNSYSQATKKPSGGGCILEWTDSVDAQGNVSISTSYYIDKGARSDTNDGEIQVFLFCQRNAALHFGAVPAWADVEDGDLAGGEALLKSALAQMNANVRYAAVRKEFFVQTLYNGQSVGPCISPVDGYQYASESQAALAAPAGAALSAVAYGTLAAATYNVQLTYTNAAGETTPSPGAELTVAADHVLHVASPAASGTATGYNVYAGNGPAVPGLSQVAGGSMGVQQLYVKVTTIGPEGETSSSIETSVTVAAGNVLVVDSPAADGIATGWNCYVGTVAGQEHRQNATELAIGANWQEAGSGPNTSLGGPPPGPTLQNATPVAIGTDWQMDLAGLKNGALPPIANGTAMSELQYLPSMVSSLPAGGHTSGSGTVRQFGCCVGGMPNVATPATLGQVSSFVTYYVNGGALTSTNDGTIRVLIIGTRERGSLPIPPAVRVQPPPATVASFGALLQPAGTLVDGFPVKGVGDPQRLDLGAEVNDAADGSYARTTPTQRDGGGYGYLGLTSSGNFASGRLLGGDSGAAAYGSGGLLGIGLAPTGIPLEVAGQGRSVATNAAWRYDDTEAGGVECATYSSGGTLRQWRADIFDVTFIDGSGRYGVGRTPSTYQIETTGGLQVVNSQASLRADDTGTSGVEAVWYSYGGYARSWLAGGDRVLVDTSTRMGIGRTPSAWTLETAGNVDVFGASPFVGVVDTGESGRAFALQSTGATLNTLDATGGGTRLTLDSIGRYGIGRTPSAYLEEVAGGIANYAPGAGYVANDSNSGGVTVAYASNGGYVEESRAGTLRRIVSSVGHGFDRTPASYEIEAAGNVQAVGANVGLLADDTGSGGLEATWYSDAGYARTALAGTDYIVLNNSGAVGIGGTPTSDLLSIEGESIYDKLAAAGSTYGVLPVGNMSAAGTTSARALIDLSQAHVNKTLDYVSDGATYFRTTSAQRDGGGWAHLGLTSAGVVNLVVPYGMHCSQVTGVINSAGYIPLATSLPKSAPVNISNTAEISTSYDSGSGTSSISVSNGAGGSYIVQVGGTAESIPAGTITGLAVDTVYFIGYDPIYPTGYTATTSYLDALADGLYPIGYIETAGPGNPGGAGGGGPAASGDSSDPSTGGRTFTEY